MRRFHQSWVWFLISCLILQSGDGFYLPIGYPHKYSVGDRLSVQVNSHSSIDTAIPFSYYSLPFCKPPEGVKDNRKNLGELLMGQRIENLPYRFSILNSLIVITLLADIMLVIFLRKIRRDLTDGFEELDKEGQDQTNEELSRWKVVVGDVFRAPDYPMLLYIMAEDGIQIIGMALVTILCASLGFMFPASRGTSITYMLFFYLILGFAAGYVVVRLWRIIGCGDCTGWVSISWKVACFFPGIAFLILTTLNFILWHSNSTGVVPFSIFVVLILLWFCISVPLTLVGGYFGAKAPHIEHPVKTNRIPCEILAQNYPSWLLVLGAGTLPFGIVFIETFFIMSSIWMCHVYSIFGFLFIIMILFMVVYAEVSILLIYKHLYVAFQLTLFGPTLQWLMSLEPSHTRTREDIRIAFKDQYSSNRELETTRQKEGEGFTDYLLQFRNKAALMSDCPPERGQVHIMVKNLTKEYYKYMFAQPISSFIDLIEARQQVEDAIYNDSLPKDNIKGSTFTSHATPKRSHPPKQSDVHTVAVQPPLISALPPVITSSGPRKSRQLPRQFTDLGMPMGLLMKKLLNHGLLTKVGPRAFTNPLPSRYNPAQYYEYHTQHGLHTDDCLHLKHEIQDLLDQGKFTVQPKRPNVVNNPLPTYGTPPPNIKMLECDNPGKWKVIEEELKEGPKVEEEYPSLEDSPTPGWTYYDIASLVTMEQMFPDQPMLIHIEINSEDELEEEQENEEQEKEVPSEEIPVRTQEEKVEGDKAPDEFKDVNMIIISDGEDEEEENYTYPGIKYDPEVEVLIEQWDVGVNVKECNPINYGTRSGRAFKHANLITELLVGQTSNPLPNVEPENEIIKQLKKPQANISIWDMLMTSQSHREAVHKALTSVKVPFETSPAQLADIVGDLYAVNTLIFTEKELPPENRDHNRALYITVDFIGNRIRQVLVDNGSALNVCPLRTLTSIGLDLTSLKPSTQGVRAYDNTRREVVGILSAEVVIGPSKFEVEFQVIDIPTSFNLLLGRPWLHAVGVVPSSLHQRLKYIENHHVVTIIADPDRVNALATEGTSPELSGFTLEQVCATAMEHPKQETLPISQIDTCNFNIDNILKRMGYFPSMGSGKNQQRPLEPIEIKDNQGQYGLGYVPTHQEKVWERERELQDKRRKDEVVRIFPLKLQGKGKNIQWIGLNLKSSSTPKKTGKKRWIALE